MRSQAGEPDLWEEQMSTAINNGGSIRSTTTIVIEEQQAAPVDHGALRDDPYRPRPLPPQQFGPGTTKVLDAINKLPLPEWAKAMVKDAALNDKSGRAGAKVRMEYLPSQGKAAKSICDFQRLALGGDSLSAEQMDQMARTGFLTKRDGITIRISSDLQESAKRFMADDSDLFKKMRGAQDGTRDGELGIADYWHALENGTVPRCGPAHEYVFTIIKSEQPLPSEADAAQAVNEFQTRRLGGAPISIAQMEEMARTGCLTRPDGTLLRLPPAVWEAARRFMANGAELFKKMESSSGGRQAGQLCSGDFFESLRAGSLCAFGGRTVTSVCRGDEMLPSEFEAARSIRDFQKGQPGAGRLSMAQLAQMAGTGYLTLPGGKVIRISPEVQNAARRFMAAKASLLRKIKPGADNPVGELSAEDFDHACRQRLISDDDGSCDIVRRAPAYTQPTEASAAKTMHDFQQRELNGETLSATQMNQMARTGYLTRSGGVTIAVGPDVQAAAQRFMASDAELFKKVESACNGRYDGKLSVRDYLSALENGRIRHNNQKREVVRARDEQVLPAEMEAVRTLRDFQNLQLGGMRLSAAQIDQMASTGYLIGDDGTAIRITLEVQTAARRFMVDDAQLFRKVESADGRNDGTVAAGDYDKARHKGLVSDSASGADIVVMRDEYQLPSASSATRSIHAFQRGDLGGETLAAAQMAQMARTGYLTRADGNTIAISHEVRDAARRFMANGGELFKKMDCAAGGTCDGLLGTGDYDKAIASGLIHPQTGPSAAVMSADEQLLPSEAEASATMQDFLQRSLGGRRLDALQMEQLARTGELVDAGGARIEAPPRVQDAARRFMANDGQLFRKTVAAASADDGVTLNKAA
jgi:hypothetical protein